MRRILVVAILLCGVAAAQAGGLDIYFVRHAETMANASGVNTSGNSNMFSEKGNEQVGALTRELNAMRFDAILVSPAERAINTILPYLKESGQKGIIWPEAVAPFQVHLLSLNQDEKAGEIYAALREAGVEVLNPVQVSAAGMDTRELKQEFGKDLSFWGGGVDTQGVLPNGTPQEVKDDVRRNVEALAPGGGFVFNTVHNIQADVPPQNIVAMWEALRDA